eukprot:Polyplicarium_translucidae@DN5155_c0_g1_i1.p3
MCEAPGNGLAEALDVRVLVAGLVGRFVDEVLDGWEVPGTSLERRKVRDAWLSGVGELGCAAVAFEEVAAGISVACRCNVFLRHSRCDRGVSGIPVSPFSAISRFFAEKLRSFQLLALRHLANPCTLR